MSTTSGVEAVDHVHVRLAQGISVGQLALGPPLELVRVLGGNLVVGHAFAQAAETSFSWLVWRKWTPSSGPSALNGSAVCSARRSTLVATMSRSVASSGGARAVSLAASSEAAPPPSLSPSSSSSSSSLSSTLVCVVAPASSPRPPPPNLDVAAVAAAVAAAALRRKRRLVRELVVTPCLAVAPHVLDERAQPPGVLTAAFREPAVPTDPPEQQVLALPVPRQVDAP
eukprot:CAMPEP_0202095024 /NCGR_PEP_ID=MMETSP0964-20121228/49336_1 /ASSEMBLY_ACC=CAM_ASM_000500 /TAXON_ID=4773 /ORGANISM="Schizochytrium aggregatum, Strain ATCC28209" /LENGTH=226 /DNA_ID=CAMNT_0048663277 /DNA_START=929 /DNA_END=1605 /DNA_ORIENTATION=-